MAVHTSIPLKRLAAIELFDQCSRRELALIDGLLTVIALPAGRTACTQGEVGRQFFVVRAGSFEVSRESDRIATLDDGDWFGEIALNCHVTRTATVTSTTPATVLVFSTREYVALRAACEHVAMGIDAAMQDRLDWLRATCAPSSPELSR
jgi:ATP-binding cassette, subfamily B, bacterial